MDLLKAMQTFVHVVETGSFTSAAERAGVSTAMVSNYVRFLEKRFACKILQRTTRRQNVTEYGKFLLENSKQIISIIDQCDLNSSLISNVVSGNIKISVPRTYGKEVIMPLLSDFSDKYPQIDFELDVSDHIVDLVETGFDVAIRIGNLSDSTLVAKSLPPYRLIVCAAPLYLERYGVPMHPHDLKEHKILQLKFKKSSDWHNMQNTWSFLSNDKWERVEISGKFITNDASSIYMLTIQGLGIAIVPEVMAKKAVEKGYLVRVLSEFELPSRPVNIVYCRDSSMSARLKIFIEFLRREIK